MKISICLYITFEDRQKIKVRRLKERRREDWKPAQLARGKRSFKQEQKRVLKK